MLLSVCVLSVILSWVTIYSLLFMCTIVVLAMEIGQTAFNMLTHPSSLDMHLDVNLQFGSKVPMVSGVAYSDCA